MDPNVHEAIASGAVADREIEMAQHLQRMRGRDSYPRRSPWRGIRIALPGLAWFAGLHPGRHA